MEIHSCPLHGLSSLLLLDLLPSQIQIANIRISYNSLHVMIRWSKTNCRQMPLLNVCFWCYFVEKFNFCTYHGETENVSIMSFTDCNLKNLHIFANILQYWRWYSFDRCSVISELRINAIVVILLLFSQVFAN